MNPGDDPWKGGAAPAPNADDFLASYKREILRWNAQFSLISRRNPETELDRLLGQCLAAWSALPTALEGVDALGAAVLGGRPDPEAAEARVRMVDLGSGAGLPGIIWHHLLSSLPTAAEGRLDSWLVEPRGQRAWFLDRCIRQFSMADIRVLERSWGAGATRRRTLRGDGNSEAPESPEPSARAHADVLWLITLKALRMTDRRILSGWRSFTGQEALGPRERLLILRLRGDAPRAKVPPDLGLQDADRWRWVACEPMPRPSSLLLSYYVRR